MANKQKVLRKPTFISIICRIFRNYIIFIALSGIIIYVGFIKYTSFDEVQIPSFHNVALAEVEKSLKSTNLTMNVVKQHSESVAKNVVISQWPPEGSRVRDSGHRKITLYVSDGPELITMPNVQNLQYNEAVNILRTIQMKSTQVLKIEPPVRVFSEVAPEGVVLSQSPLPGDIIKSGTQISLVISNGKESVYIVVPELVGSDIISAEIKLTELKLTSEKVPLYNRHKPANQILKQEPAPGEKLKESGVVKIFYNARPADSQNQQQIRYMIFPYTTPNYMNQKRIKIIVEDSTGEKIVYDNTEPAAKQLFVKISVSGSGKIKVYVDGTLDEIKNIE
ncbi:PASTA domain-containing protein [Candidatus Dependentiae bacterium]|nr:PASTA domain-containing protein [Candidatus Dependentiae bacterium]